MTLPRIEQLEVIRRDHTRQIPTRYSEMSNHDKRESLKECIVLALLEKPEGVHKKQIKKLSDPKRRIGYYQWEKAFNELLASNRIYSPELNWNESKNPRFYLGRWEHQMRMVRGEK